MAGQTLTKLRDDFRLLSFMNCNMFSVVTIFLLNLKLFVWICQSLLDKAILWIEDLYLSNGLKLKTLSQIQRFSLDWMLTDCSLVEYYDVSYQLFGLSF